MGQPLNYIDFKSLSHQRNYPRDECDAMCEKCPKSRICLFSRVEKIPVSGYRDSGDSDFNSRILNANSYSSGYSSRGDQSGFSDLRRDYSGISKDYSLRGEGYSGNSTSGFHGSYEVKNLDEVYSGMTTKGGKSNYLSGSGSGKNKEY